MMAASEGTRYLQPAQLEPPLDFHNLSVPTELTSTIDAKASEVVQRNSFDAFRPI